MFKNFVNCGNDVRPVLAWLLELAGMDGERVNDLTHSFSPQCVARQLLALPIRLQAYSAPDGIRDLPGYLRRAMAEDWELPAR